MHLCMKQNSFCELLLMCCLITRAETIRSALEILAICSVMPKAQLQLCESIKLPEREAVPAIRFVCLFQV
jgi:hypothetical protein